MRKVFLTLMVFFSFIGSAITVGASFLTLNKLTEGIDYDKVAESKQQIENMKAEGVDLANHPEYADTISLIESIPPESSIMMIKGLSVLAIVLVMSMCVTTFKKHSSAMPMAIMTAVVAIGLFIITPDLKGGMTGPAPLKNIITVAVAVLILATCSSFGAIKKLPK